MEKTLDYIKILGDRCKNAHLKAMIQSNDYLYAYTQGFQDALDEIHRNIECQNNPKKILRNFLQF